MPVRPRNWESADVRWVRAVRASRGVVWVGLWMGGAKEDEEEEERRERWR